MPSLRLLGLALATTGGLVLENGSVRIGPGGYPRGLELRDATREQARDQARDAARTMLVCAGGGAAGIVVYRGHRTGASDGDGVGDTGIWTGWAPIGVVSSDARPGSDVSNCVLHQQPTGELLAAYRHHTGCGPAGRSPTPTPRPSRPGVCTDYTLRVSVSDDRGVSWQPRSTVVQGTIGMWEPAFFQLGSGLAVAYSQELSNGGLQSIVWKVSGDAGRSWGPVAVLSDGRQHDSRDGMPGLTRLRDGSVLLVFEGFWRHGWGRFSVQIRRSFDDGASWDAGNVIFAPSNASHNAGAPQIAVGSGGNGTEVVFVSFMTDEDAIEVSWPGDASSKVMVGAAPAPGQAFPAFDVPGRETMVPGPGAMWPGLVPLSDGGVFATVGKGGSYLIGPLRPKTGWGSLL